MSKFQKLFERKMPLIAPTTTFLQIFVNLCIVLIKNSKVSLVQRSLVKRIFKPEWANSSLHSSSNWLDPKNISNM